jgi:hypothetical protein
MRGAFDTAFHRHEIGTAESGIAHGRQKCSIAENLPFATPPQPHGDGKPMMSFMVFTSVYDDLGRLVSQSIVERAAAWVT